MKKSTHTFLCIVQAVFLISVCMISDCVNAQERHFPRGSNINITCPTSSDHRVTAVRFYNSDNDTIDAPYPFLFKPDSVKIPFYNLQHKTEWWAVYLFQWSSDGPVHQTGVCPSAWAVPVDNYPIVYSISELALWNRYGDVEYFNTLRDQWITLKTYGSSISQIIVLPDSGYHKITATLAPANPSTPAIFSLSIDGIEQVRTMNGGKILYSFGMALDSGEHEIKIKSRYDHPIGIYTELRIEWLESEPSIPPDSPPGLGMSRKYD